MNGPTVPSVCAYCGLPTPRYWWGRDAADEPAYCCYGCRFAASVSGAGDAGAESRWMFTRLALAIFCTMNVMAFTMAIWSGDVYEADDSTLSQSLTSIFRYLSLFFALPVFYALGLPLLENAWHSLRRGIANIDVLLIAGVGASFVYSVYSVLREEGPIYFEVGCTVLLLVTLGRWLEATGKARASHSLDALEKLLPETVCILEGGREIEIPLRDVAIGACVRVRAGERIPCDGVLLGQAGHVDEQLLTGESAARTKEPGDALHAGTLNLDADLRLRVTHRPEDGTLGRLVRLVRQAREARGHYEQVADRLARAFLPLVVALALAATLYHGLATEWTAGILAGLSVVLIACPCALGIATPLAMWTALGQAARHRVLFRGGDTLERLARVQQICFDKTGTLTTGMPTVQAFVVASGEDADACRRWASTLGSASRHVHARALVRFLDVPGHDVFDAVQTVPGRGLCVRDSHAGPIALGSERWMQELGAALPADLQRTLDDAHARGLSTVCLAWGGTVRAVAALAQEWRPETGAALASLQAKGLGLTILTGDPNPHAGAGLPAEVTIHRGLLPEDKLRRLHEMRDAGSRVAMVGDGINDSPALAASDVGIALGCGADISRDAADVCLLDDDLRKIPWTIDLAQRTVRIIQQNLFWAFAYNIVGIALACLGKLNPVLAALAMTLSSFFVVVNSLRLRADGDPLTPTPPLAEARRP